jgi:protein-S-isoprenylcysteine O-methyltransferase Ste14
MPPQFFPTLYITGLVLAEGLRFPRRLARFRERQSWKPAGRSTQRSEQIVLSGVILGFWILPLIYSFTPWLNCFDYHLPNWVSWTAAATFLGSLIIRWRAQRTLDRSWSFTLETSKNHRLITHGIFSFTRHPIYLSLIFWAVSQAGLVQNYLAGLGGSIAVLLIWLVRVPREEQLLLEFFGSQYQEYMTRTGKLFPKRSTEH